MTIESAKCSHFCEESKQFMQRGDWFAHVGIQSHCAQGIPLKKSLLWELDGRSISFCIAACVRSRFEFPEPDNQFLSNKKVCKQSFWGDPLPISKYFHIWSRGLEAPIRQRYTTDHGQSMMPGFLFILIICDASIFNAWSLLHSPPLSLLCPLFECHTVIKSPRQFTHLSHPARSLPS